MRVSTDRSTRGSIIAIQNAIMGRKSATGPTRLSAPLGDEAPTPLPEWFASFCGVLFAALEGFDK